nr:hypothetical protein CFP56_37299 [Quercus suber]
MTMAHRTARPLSLQARSSIRPSCSSISRSGRRRHCDGATMATFRIPDVKNEPNVSRQPTGETKVAVTVLTAVETL